MNLRIHIIIYDNSLGDGPGLRTLLFFQGCRKRCRGCHNPQTWDENGGSLVTVSDLVSELNQNCRTHRITLTGGEPLLQTEALIELVTALDASGYDIALYTGMDRSDVPDPVLRHITYLKYGAYVEQERVTVHSYIGSSNQRFERVKRDDG